MQSKILIIDGLNLFIRTWAVVPEMNINGDHVGGLTGFLRTMKIVMRDTKPSLVIVAWDGQGGSTKRRGIYAEYKAGRKPRVNREYEFDSPADSLKNMNFQQIKLKNYLSLIGVAQIEVEMCEADDIIGYLCRHVFCDTDKVVVSSDKDFLQLIDDHTLIYSSSKKLYFSAELLMKSYGVLPENFIYMKALMGDPSDNIKGIKGIGEKTVVKMFPFVSERQTSLDEIILHATNNITKNAKFEAVVNSKEILIENVKLMQLISPIISSQSIRAIKYALESENTFFKISDFKLCLLKDGIRITDADFFSVIREYQLARNFVLSK
jgi:DNA polymerase-1